MGRRMASRHAGRWIPVGMTTRRPSGAVSALGLLPHRALQAASCSFQRDALLDSRVRRPELLTFASASPGPSTSSVFANQQKERYP